MKRLAWVVVLVLGYGGLARLSTIEYEGTAFQDFPYVAFCLFIGSMLLLYPKSWEEVK